MTTGGTTRHDGETTKHGAKTALAAILLIAVACSDTLDDGGDRDDASGSFGGDSGTPSENPTFLTPGDGDGDSGNGDSGDGDSSGGTRGTSKGSGGDTEAAAGGTESMDGSGGDSSGGGQPLGGDAGWGGNWALGGATHDPDVDSCIWEGAEPEPGTYELSEGDSSAPLCDLFGGEPAVQACFDLDSAEDSCDELPYTTYDLHVLVEAEFTECGHPFSAGLFCGPVKVPTASGAKCCWEMDGFCQEDEVFSQRPRDACARDADEEWTPSGCEAGADATPHFPVASGDFLYFPAPSDELLCDLGGGKTVVHACVPLQDGEECNDLRVDTDNLMLGAQASVTCDGSWGVGILCGPVRVDIPSGPACCWGIDGHGEPPTWE